MYNRIYADQTCSIARSLDVVGERWSLLIVREALVGATRFDVFLRNLGIARNVLADRLGTLVDGGVLQRVPYQERPLRHEYHLTDRGRELVPVILALMQWGDRHFAGPAGAPRIAEHDGCGGAAQAVMHCVECDRPLTPAEVTTRPNPDHVPPR
ncbi:helix-turn-helix domain-containing protein [Micromonospora sp. NPDC047738]|uniref:winged helix-turn-helix transcriptional regulator n=1 Tax=unclassified Micromonospora TaxID=2617518 RepID=UPI0033E205F0